MSFALVAVPVPLGRAFSYRVPPELADRVVPGARVLVQFGRRSVLGVVVELSQQAPQIDPSKIKPIQTLVDSEPVLPPSLLKFLVEMARYYLAPIGEVMRLALPAVERERAKQLSREGLIGQDEIQAVGKQLQVAVAVEDEALSDAARSASEKLRGQAQAILEHLREHGDSAITDLEQTWKSARSAVKRLAEQQLVGVEMRQDVGDEFFREPAEPDEPPELNPAQRAAVDAITGAIAEGAGGGFLLQGVTASGKTEVYLRCVQKALDGGGSAIILVPEIALTPQLVVRFRARLGDEIAVLHSALTDRERHLMWKRLRTGALRVAVGARSALFAPLENLKLICVDEEHDSSFKQEEGVRYHARDMALLRAHRAGAVCVLGSATPSLTSVGLVESGKLTRLRLPDRAHATAQLPKIEVVDLKRTGPGPSGDRVITVPLFRALQEVLARKEQALLFLNRRGFAPSLVCESCGEIFECPNCSVPLTVHRGQRATVQCHHCGHSESLVERCASCGAARLVEEGTGTERVESALWTLFPEARVARLDRDVASGLKSRRVLDQMRAGEVDILVGTQMITKGHDLPQVTLVGVLNADSGLSWPDYQAAERTFQLLVQVAGRAGRADAPGRVLIQTRNPQHPAVSRAITHDVDAFIVQELASRKELGYPPYSRVALVRVDATDERLASQGATHMAEVAQAAILRAGVTTQVLGPAPAPIAKVRNRYRYRFMLRGPTRASLREALLAVARTAPDRRVRVSVDVDPVNML